MELTKELIQPAAMCFAAEFKKVIVDTMAEQEAKYQKNHLGEGEIEVFIPHNGTIIHKAKITLDNLRLLASEEGIGSVTVKYRYTTYMDLVDCDLNDLLSEK